jgi:2-oxoisovalerate dehydrogenase E2 component (dihydrolipoyl transacylase)
MAYRVRLPQVGESVTEAVIGKWLKKPGDHVEKFDPIVEVVTDKVSMEFPAPEAGTLTRIVYDEGATVPMGTVIAEMDLDDPDAVVEDEREAEGAGGSGPAAEAGEAEEVGRVGRMVTGANVGPTGGVFADASASRPRRAAGQPETGAAAARRDAGPGAGPARPDVGDLSTRLSPVVVRLAAQHRVDLSGLTGTGVGGRITKQDVMAAVEARSAASQAALGAPTRGASPAAVSPETPPTPAAPATPATPAAPAEGSTARAPAAAPADQLIEPSPVRKIIASRMVRSVTEIPHAWTAIEVDVGGMMACRDSKRAEFQTRLGVDLSYVAFSVYAIASALRANPIVNSSWEDGRIRVKGRVNIGVAVAAPHGLVVPVVHDADRLSIAAISRVLVPLVERARTDRLAQQDVRDGTFTLNNTGALGSVWGRAIINHPQAAILNTEAIVKRPVVLSGPGGDAIAIRPIMNLSLSFDHRVLDGAEASKFIQDVKRRIEAFGPETDLE